MQPRLEISTPGDRYEQEADRIAEDVLRMFDDSAAAVVDEEAGTPQAKETEGHAPAATRDVLALIDALRGGGEPLPATARAFFEPRFGQDFGHVRVHRDARAAASARGVSAQAYTVGSDIVFGAGRYAPETDAGKKLLAHELAHVVQQDRAATTSTLTAARPTIQRKPLTDGEKKAAVTFNQGLISRIYTIGVLRVTVGLEPNPATLDEAFATALADWQEKKGLTSNGKIDPVTVPKLVVELIDKHPRDAIIVAVDAHELYGLAGAAKTGKLDFIRVSTKEKEENCCFEKGKEAEGDSDAVTHGGKFDPNAVNRGGSAEICFCQAPMRAKAKTSYEGFVRIIGHELVHIPQHEAGIGTKHLMDQALYEFKAYFWEVCGKEGAAPQYPAARRKAFAQSAIDEYNKIKLADLSETEKKQVDDEKALVDKLRGMRDQDIKAVPCKDL